jgi:lipoate-protein ligase A
MYLLELTLPTPAENLALDEALLEAAEAGELGGEVLRLWEMPQVAVVIGRSSRVADEVDQAAAEAANVPIVRRVSGGASVVVGPGCLMYSVVLRYAGREHLRLIDEAHRHVLGVIRAALRPVAGTVEHLGMCDLAIGGRKFSGNALRCKRDHLLYHGTLLYDFDLSLISRLLKMPPRQPAYRDGRSHGGFVMNIAADSATLREALAAGFVADQLLADWPVDLTRQLAKDRYSQRSWNFER